MRVLPLLFLLACAPEYDFVEVGAGGAALESHEDGGAKVRKDHFKVGGESATPLVDYLFVVDNSVSMKPLLTQFQAGFAALAKDAESFGDRARVAVITTLPSDPDAPGALHPAVTVTPGLEFDPGFASPVTQSRLRDYKAVAPRMHKRMPLRGCDAWFAPSEQNKGGVSCLEAHTQVGLTAMGVEAGLVATAQLLDREDFAFREGAAVNIVFVSDTHDPGIHILAHPGADALLALRPEPLALTKQVQERFGSSAVRLHAIAPATVCTSEDWTAIGPVYQQAAEATGGVFIDICTADDYRPLLAELTRAGKTPTVPVLPLGRTPAEILGVTVDGEAAAYTLTGGRVELDEMPTVEADIEVLYRFE